MSLFFAFLDTGYWYSISVMAPGYLDKTAPVTCPLVEHPTHELTRVPLAPYGTRPTCRPSSR